VSETGSCPNRCRAKAAAVAASGLWGMARGPAGSRPTVALEPNGMGRPAGAGESPVGERRGRRLAMFPSTAGHGKPGRKPGGPPPKATYPRRPIAHSTVRERWKGPREGGAKSLKPRAPEQSEHDSVV
jgi:hypothetical protein